MVKISAEIEDGVVVVLDLKGHTKEPVCAALSELVKLYSMIVDKVDKTQTTGEAKAPGQLSLHVVSYPTSAQEFLRGASAMLTMGLSDLQKQSGGDFKFELDGLCVWTV